MEKKRHLLLWKKTVTISRDIILQTQFHTVKAVVFPVVMHGSQLDHKEGWTLKICFFWIMCWRRLLDSWSPLDGKKIKPVHPKGNQPWIFTGRTDAETETPILWPPDVKNWLTGKDPDWERLKAGVKEAAENEMVGGHLYSMDMSLSKLREIVKDREA